MAWHESWNECSATKKLMVSCCSNFLERNWNWPSMQRFLPVLMPSGARPSSLANQLQGWEVAR